PVLELTIDPQKRIFESFDRTKTLFVSIAGERPQTPLHVGTQ
ncbi:MAG: hypothetical protein QOI53_3315, partial [Verrucomicrobiota bacterium]|nr:hypothetical protein [Verrucomicrobiota bacterium]